MFRRVMLAGGLAVLVLLGYAVKQAAFPAPEATVQRYFDALRSRNLGEAAEQVIDNFSLQTETTNWSSMWQVISDGHYQPPANVRMGGWEHAPTAEGERVVAVQYDLAGTTYSSLLKLRRVDGLWRITNGTGTLAVNVPNALINGHRPTEGRSLRLFPGIYQVMSNPHAPLLRAAPVDVVVMPGKTDRATLAPTLATEALAKVRDHLGVLIRACETSLGVSKNDCPYRSIDAAGFSQVKWTEAIQPELAIEQSGLDTVVVRTVSPGSVRLNAIDAAGQGIDRVDSFWLNGKCVEKDATVSCTFTA